MKKEAMINILKNVTRNGLTPGAYAGLEKMLEDLEAEIAAQNARKACGSNAVNIERSAKNIIKSSKKVTPHTHFHGAWIHDEKQYVCDTFRMLRIEKPLPLEQSEVPITPDQAKNLANFFIEADKSDAVFQLPTAAELKEMIKAQKDAAKAAGIKSPKISYFTGGPVIGAEYLLDAIVATGAAELRTSRSKGKYISPCFLQSDDCQALVLPVNAPADKHPAGSCAITA